MLAPKMTGLIDRAMDWAVVPGFTSLGFRARSRGWEETPDLAGRSVAVTGASSGLGAATCEILAAAGADVHMVVRNPGKGEDVRAGIAERNPGASLTLWECDVSDLASVRAFAERHLADGPGLAALVNNAGSMPPERRHSPDGFELTFATNVLGPFLLTTLLLPALRAGAPSRVINVSSGGMYTAKLDAADLQLARRDYNSPRFYAHTKRCEVILAELFQERAGNGVSFHSMHPGWADTPGVQESLPGFRRVMGPLLRDEHQGADTIAWLCWAPEPLREPGRFWHDRAPRATHKAPWTREDESDRELLWHECIRLSGLSGSDEMGGHGEDDERAKEA